MDAKNKIRRDYIEARKDLNADFCNDASNIILNKIINNDLYKKSETLYIYVDTGNEVHTRKLIEHSLKLNKKVACPKVSGRKMCFIKIDTIADLMPGKFGIYEPVGNEAVSSDGLIIVPGVAFDKNCSRIGYGGGYYDRFLAERSFHTIALAYEMQILEYIPTCKFDVKVEMIITEKNIYYKSLTSGQM